MLTRPLKVRYRRLYGALFGFLMILFAGMSLLVLSTNGLTDVSIVVITLNVILLLVLYYVMNRARKSAACLFDMGGVTRCDGQRFSWSEFKGVNYLMAIKPENGKEYLWRIELDFTGGRVWIIPQRVINLDEVNEVVNMLPGEHRKRSA